MLLNCYGRKQKMSKGNNRKRGQVAIWIILGIILAGAIALLFVFDKVPKLPIPRTTTPFEMQPFLDSCTRNAVEEAVNIMLPQGGFLSPENAIVFEGKKVEYLCDYVGYYDPCISQHPLLLNDIKEEIKRHLTSELDSCFDKIKDETERRKGQIIFDNNLPPKVDVGLGEDKVILDIEKELTLTKNNETKRFKDFHVVLQSPIYNLASVAAEISNQEAKYCYFEYVGYSIIYPRYNINKYVLSDSTKIYSINDVESGKEMLIAIKSCPLPSGLPT